MTNKKILLFLNIFICVGAFLFESVCFANSKVPSQIESFMDENVQNYGQYYIDSRTTLSFISEPQEYVDVVKMGKNAVPYLILFLSNPKPSIRIASIFALSEITNEQFGTLDDFEHQINTDQHKNEIEKTSFYKFPGEALKKREYLINEYELWWNKNKNKSRIQWFIDDLKDSNELIKRTAAIRLGEMKSKKAIPALKDALRDPKISFYAKQALANINK